MQSAYAAAASSTQKLSIDRRSLDKFQYVIRIRMKKHFGVVLDYICPLCNESVGQIYRPFCGNCGEKLPSEARMQAFGHVEYLYQNSKQIDVLDEINSLLKSLGDRKHFVGSYFSFARTLELAIPPIDSEKTWYKIVCIGTQRVEMPVADGWTGTLSISKLANDLTQLTDNENKVDIIAGRLFLMVESGSPGARN